MFPFWKNNIPISWLNKETQFYQLIKTTLKKIYSIFSFLRYFFAFHSSGHKYNKSSYSSLLHTLIIEYRVVTCIVFLMTHLLNNIKKKALLRGKSKVLRDYCKYVKGNLRSTANWEMTQWVINCTLGASFLQTFRLHNMTSLKDCIIWYPNKTFVAGC